MLNEKVPIEVRGRRMEVELEGLTPIEVTSIAGEVSDRMSDIERANPKVADTGKLAILTALEFAAELRRLKAQQENDRLAEDHKIDEMTVALQNALETR